MQERAILFLHYPFMEDIMPRQVRQRTILDVIADTFGPAYYVGRKRPQHLFIVTITGAASVSIRGRQKDGPWRTLVTTAINAEVNLDDYGWYEFQAITSGMGIGATASVVWSWD